MPGDRRSNAAFARRVSVLRSTTGLRSKFIEVPNERLDKIRISETFGNKDFFYAKGEAASGYYKGLGLKKFDRHLLYVAPDYFVVRDELETEKPPVFSFLLNADREIKINGSVADLINETAALRVINVPSNQADSKVVPQMISGSQTSRQRG